jgi:S-DNA-T family DNA segregation ATPase FtsK/SpoIIIE
VARSAKVVKRQAKAQVKAQREGVSDELKRRLREAGALLLLPLALYLLVCLLSYNDQDPSWGHMGVADHATNFGGAVGANIANLLRYIFGLVSYGFPLLLLALGIQVIRHRGERNVQPWEPSLRLIGFVFFFITAPALVYLNVDSVVLPEGPGGIVGKWVGHGLHNAFGDKGAPLLLLAVCLIAITLATGLSWFRLMDATGELVMRFGGWFGGKLRRAPDVMAARSARAEREVVKKAEAVKQAKREPVRIETPAPMVVKSDRATRENQIPLFTGASMDGEIPPLSLLDEAPPQGPGYSEETLEVLSRQVELKLKDFRVEARVVGVYPGPVITRFELEPAAGVRGSQVSSLDKDIARGLSVVSVRVVDVIPGKNVIGLEIPNTKKQIVYLSEILRSERYDQVKSPLALALGKDIGGKAVVTDLAKMPHLLVAGTTGSGKSVGINAMILSLLYKADASHTRLILIDPKMLEMSVYEGIPHLLAPVVTDMRQASNALNWCVGEMEKRYRLMSKMGVRNLAGYNTKIRDAIKREEPIPNPFSLTPDQPEPLSPLPTIVVVIDELADLMMVVGKKIEELIARLAQKARAAGIHLILATQRPSVDVITGLIKANIPTRIAFQVSSKIDSRTILDQMGAETLLGQGDMLYMPPGTGLPVRVHGAFCSDDEVHRVVESLKSQGEPNYVEGLLEGGLDGDGAEGASSVTGIGGDAESDPMYDQACEVVLKHRRASISLVQRHLRIGYNRAARLLEQMEQSGMVSAMQSNGNREILVPAAAAREEA